eukprot:TRINITY_DN2675_c0_g1_i22.p1 TRINITY_DN2675_c0_g1~~TRINITY_DN2675_c0_g1_i22.p1  ORF type:complete len:399 (+),score=28.34 TRINITY_DN2675_c0_g1_i22:619-1815(+)
MGDFDSLSSKQKFEQKNRILRSYVMAVRRSLNGSPSKSATILVDNLPQELPKFPPYVLIFAPRGTTVPCPPPTCITIWLNATKKKVNLKTSMHTELTCNAPPPPPPVDETFVIPDEPVLAVSTNLKRNCAALVKKLPRLRPEWVDTRGLSRSQRLHIRSLHKTGEGVKNVAAEVANVSARLASVEGNPSWVCSAQSRQYTKASNGHKVRHNQLCRANATGHFEAFTTFCNYHQLEVPYFGHFRIGERFFGGFIAAHHLLNCRTTLFLLARVQQQVHLTYCLCRFVGVLSAQFKKRGPTVAMRFFLFFLVCQHQDRGVNLNTGSRPRPPPLDFLPGERAEHRSRRGGMPVPHHHGRRHPRGTTHSTTQRSNRKHAAQQAAARERKVRGKPGNPRCSIWA